MLITIKSKQVFIRMMIAGFFVSMLFSSCIKNVTKQQVVYENDFEDFNLKGFVISGWLNGGFGTLSDIKIVNYNGTKVLGRFNNCMADLVVRKLPAHTAIHVEFDLYLHDNWKNDLWKMTFDNQDQLMTGFSNDSSVLQSYPNWIGNGSAPSPAGSNAFNRNLPGACSQISSPHGSSMYKIVSTVLHSDSTFHFTCSDATHPFNDFCQISWSIDNLKITTIDF